MEKRRGPKIIRVRNGKEAVMVRHYQRYRAAYLEGPAVRYPDHVVAPKRVVVQHPGRSVFAIPLHLTLCEGTHRSWEEADRLLEVANRLFACAALQFELAESHQCAQVPQGVMGCPFAQDLDHSFEWLQVVLVRSLPGDKPMLPSCGRCLLLSDNCDDRSFLQGLGTLLGLWTAIDASASERLMGSGTGLQLVEKEQSWLRWHAANLCGESWPLQTLTVPLWLYGVDSPESYRSQRSERSIREILQRVNQIWEAAGLVFEVNSFCHLHQDEVDAHGWERTQTLALPKSSELMEPLVRHGRRAMHLIFLGGSPTAPPLNMDPQLRLTVVADTLTENRSRTLAWALGRLLGMCDPGGTDQLMCRNGDGYRLAAQELMVARNQATALLHNPL